MATGFVTSTDGTAIGRTREGAGPPLVMVHCVGVSRSTTPQPTLPAHLAEHFTVFSYDRRGKGQSGNTQPYAVEREFEDLAAVLDLADGPADVYAFSSGATLALQAAEAGLPIRRLALLEPPLFAEADPDHHMAADAQRRVDADVAAAQRWFSTDIVGIPEEILAQMPPPSEKDLSNARTIVHELTFLPGTPATRFAAVETPTLLMASDHTAPEILQWAIELEVATPSAVRHVLPGEWHGVDDATLTAAMSAYLLP